MSKIFYELWASGGYLAKYETLGQALVRLRDEPSSLDVVVTEAQLVSVTHP